jgi:hypothetical protein
MFYSIKNPVFSLVKLVPEPIDPNVQHIYFAIVFDSNVILVLNHVIDITLVLLVEILLVFGLTAVNGAFGS